MNSSTHTFEKSPESGHIWSILINTRNIAKIISTTTHNTIDIKLSTKGLLSAMETTAQPFKPHFHKFRKPQKTQTIIGWNHTYMKINPPSGAKRQGNHEKQGDEHTTSVVPKETTRQDSIQFHRIRRIARCCSSITPDGQIFISTRYNTPNSN